MQSRKWKPLESLDMVIIAAMLSAQQFNFARPSVVWIAANEAKRPFVHPLSSHLTHLNVFYTYLMAEKEEQGMNK